MAAAGANSLNNSINRANSSSQAGTLPRTSSSTRLNILEPPVSLLGPPNSTRMFDRPDGAASYMAQGIMKQASSITPSPAKPAISVSTIGATATAPPPPKSLSSLISSGAQEQVPYFKAPAYALYSHAQGAPHPMMPPAPVMRQRVFTGHQEIYPSPVPDDDQDMLMGGSRAPQYLIGRSHPLQPYDLSKNVDKMEDEEEEYSSYDESEQAIYGEGIGASASHHLPLKLQQKSAKPIGVTKAEKSSSASSESSSDDEKKHGASRSKSEQKQKFNQGAWTTQEHEQFLKGLSVCGHQWKKIAVQFVRTRSRRQVASHAQKYLEREKRRSALSKKEVRNTNRPTLII
jgi:SHAQKYF class myb-like DNA-binding protein